MTENRLACRGVLSNRYITSAIYHCFDGFQVVLLLIQQDRKYEDVHTLAYLLRMDIAVRQNGKSSHVSGNGTDHFHIVI
jgi:hypothetical protein